MTLDTKSKVKIPYYVLFDISADICKSPAPILIDYLLGLVKSHNQMSS